MGAILIQIKVGSASKGNLDVRNILIPVLAGITGM
jgi:hypothetical protein